MRLWKRFCYFHGQYSIKRISISLVSSPEPKAQWWAYRIGRPLSSVCVYVCQHFQTSSPQKPLGKSKSNFIWSLHGIGERKFVLLVQVTWSIWPPCPYMVKIFFGTKRPMTLKLGMRHRVLEYYQVCSNDDLGLTLTYFTAGSNLVPYAFVWTKVKQWIFQKLLKSMMSKFVHAIN